MSAAFFSCSSAKGRIGKHAALKKRGDRKCVRPGHLQAFFASRLRVKNFRACVETCVYAHAATVCLPLLHILFETPGTIL